MRSFWVGGARGGSAARLGRGNFARLQCGAGKDKSLVRGRYYTCQGYGDEERNEESVVNDGKRT